MRDMNFFQPYIDAKKQKRRYRDILVIASIIIVSLGFVSYLFNTITIAKLNSDIKDLNKKYEAEKAPAKQNELALIENQYNILKQYESRVDAFNAMNSNIDSISSKLIEDIQAVVPKGVTIKTINIDKGSLDISAEADSRESIALFQHNLNSSYFVKSSFIGSIPALTKESKNNTYSFSINCLLKDVESNENK